MATNDKVESENRKEELKLKHLGFVRIYSIHILVYVSNLYEYAKQNSGPLRSGIRSVEGNVTSVLGPVYHKFKGVPLKSLIFLDNKVEEGRIKFDGSAPPLAKQLTYRAWGVVLKTTSLIKSTVYEARRDGVASAANHIKKDSEQFMSKQAVNAWFKLNEVPVLRTVAEIAVPTAAHWSGKYNQTVTYYAKKGYAVFGYLPLVPVETIAKAFRRREAAKEGADGGATTKQHSS
ncbi:hypothetical protein Syun_024495 [Stephania yunnanensis]|uniref:Uncharacterized protein n=1 Tax=Stephania yunnanensis TaxID=152371 RepID=A0AAP0I4H9_9MAGN